MVDFYTSLFHHLFELAITDWICHVPSYAPENNLSLEMAALEVNHCFFLGHLNG
jgi:hypothetical protein